MKRFFEALASLVLSRPKLVVFVWLLLALLGGLLAQTLSGRLTAEGPFPSHSESGREARAVNAHVPEYRGIPMAVAITTRNPNPGQKWTQTEATRAHLRSERRVAGLMRKLPKAAAFESAPTETVGRRGRITAVVTLVGFRLRMTYEEAQDRIRAMEDELNKAASPSLSIDLLGSPVISERYAELTHDDLVAAERLALPLTGGLLLFAFMSVVAALLPLLLASAVVVVTLGCLALLAQVISLSVFTTTAVTVLALGLGIDYSLFMVTRMREERAAGCSLEDALRRSIASTGQAIALSGVAIALSLLSLLAVGLPDYSSMAVGGAIVSLVAVAGALTLLPAVVKLLGHRLDRLYFGRQRSASDSRLWRGLARQVVKRPVSIAVVTSGGLLLLAIPATSLTPAVRPLGSLPPGDKVTREFDHVANTYGAGLVAPVEIATAELPRVNTALTKTEAFPTSIGFAGTGKWAMVLAIFGETPDTVEAQATIRSLRRELDTGASSTMVGGLPAAALDLSDWIQERSAAVVFLACVLVIVALMVGLRSILIPIKAVLGTLLSVGAALGVLALLFPADGAGSNIEPVIPLVLFTIIFGLSVDYEVFLLSRVREEVLSGADTRLAVSTALMRSARPITFAGLCLASVFIVLATSSLHPFQQLGIGVAIGVVLDVTVVRCLLMPAAAVILGRWNWWLPRLGGRLGIARR